MKKRLLAQILLLLVLLLSACSTPGDSSNPGQSSADSTPKNTSTSGETGELTTLTLVANIDNITLDNALNGVGETLEDNRWNDLIAQELGYKIEYLWVTTDGEQFSQKFNTSLAAGDIPDIVRLDATQFTQATQNGLLADLTGLYEQEASPLLKDIMTSAGPLPMKSSQYEGKQYALPLCDADIERGSLLWIRQDWLEQTGNEIPETIDDMIKVMNDFRKLSGDGSVGLVLKKDLFGINSNYCINGFANAFNAYPDLWVEKDGKITYGTIQPEMKEALAKLSEMYQDGLIDPEFVVKDEAQAAEAVVSGKNGVFYGAHWSPLSGILDNLLQDEKAEWIPWHLPSANSGKQTQVGVQMATNVWFASSINSPAPEAVIEIANLYAEKTFDPEKQEYEYYSNPGGKAEGLWKFSPVYMMTPNKNIDIAEKIHPYLEENAENPEGLFGEEKTMYDYARAGMNGDREMQGWNLIFGIDGACQVQSEQQIAPGNTMMSAFYGAPTETMSSSMGVLNEALKAEYTKIITGQLPIDAFETSVEAWLNGGGQKIIDEANEWYKGIDSNS